MESEFLGSELVLNFASCEVGNVYGDQNDVDIVTNTYGRHEEYGVEANKDNNIDDDDDAIKDADILVNDSTESQEVTSSKVSTITTKNEKAIESDLNKIKSKSEAKKLGKTLYKQWKKLKRESKEKHKAHSAKHNDKHKRHRNEENDDDEDDNSEHENTFVNENEDDEKNNKEPHEQENNIEDAANSRTLARKSHKRHRDEDADADNANNESTHNENETKSKRHRHHKHRHRSKHEDSDKHKRHHRHRRKHSDKKKNHGDNEGEDDDKEMESTTIDNDNNLTSVIASSEFANFTNAERDAAEHKARRREELLRQASSLNAAKTLTPRQATAKVHEMAKNLVEAMRNARAKDDLILSRNARMEKNKKKTENKFNSSSVHEDDDVSKEASNMSAHVSGFSPLTQSLPLNKITLKATVESQCQRSFLVGPLIEAGILQELSYWLYDFDRNEPAAYELRTTALDILLRFPIEGELENVPGRRSRNGDEDLTIFTGMDREHLIHTDIGRAVNALRLHSNEIAQNRSKCVQLLERLSRAMSGGVRTSADVFDRSVDLQDNGARFGNRSSVHGAGQSVQAAATTLLWEQKGIRGIASPFNIVQTSSEAFQKAFAKPDPRDPTSYHNLLPWREPVRAITNLSGRLAHQIVQPEMPK